MISLSIFACGGNDVEPYNPATQLTIDLATIDAYLDQEGINPSIDPQTNIRYIITRAGDGTGANIGDSVKVNYVLYNLNGTLLDQNDPNNPFIFELGSRNIIAGFSRAVELLSTTGSGEFYIPSVYAYQNRGTGNIGPNESLLFEIELLEVLD